MFRHRCSRFTHRELLGGIATIATLAAIPKSGCERELLAISTAAVIVILLGFVLLIFRASDRVAAGPILYKKCDYGAHVQGQSN